MKKNNKIIYILSSIIALIVLCISLIFVLKKFDSNENGTIKLEFIDLNDELVEKKELEFIKNEGLYDICKKEYDNIVINSYGFLDRIGPFETSYNEGYMTYISLYVDDLYCQYSFNQIPFTNGTKITFKLDEYKYA